MSERVGFFLLVSVSDKRPDQPVAAAAKLASQERIQMKLAIKIEQQPDGNYRACCPSLPGCSVRGQTREDARSRIYLAVQGYLASLDVCLPRELSTASAMEVA